MSPSEAAVKMRELAGEKGLKRVIVNSIKRGMTVGRKDALAKLRASGVGRALTLQRKKRGPTNVPPLIVTVGKVRQNGTEYTSSLQEKGMAALIEKGGHTKPHRITAKASKLLRFGSGARWSFAKVVSHPGSIVPRNAHLEHAAKVAGEAVPGQIDAGFTAAVQKAGL